MALSSDITRVIAVYVLVLSPLLSDCQIKFPGSTNPHAFHGDPYTDQTRSEIEQNRFNAQQFGQLRPSGNQRRPYEGQFRPPPIQIRPSVDQTTLSENQAVYQIIPPVNPYRPSVDQVRPPKTPILPSVGQNRPSVGHIYPSIGQILPAKTPILPSVGQNRPSAGQIYPSIDQVLPPKTPILPSVGQNRPSPGQIPSSVGQILPSIDQARPVVTSTDVDDNDGGYEWEQEEMFEGDIEGAGGLGDRNGVTEADRLWPNGIVYYKFKGPAVSKKGMDVVRWAMKHIQDRTCIRFQEQKMERDFITIQFHSKGCWSSVGRTGGEQVLNLNFEGCLGSNGTAVHEMLHALGFYHEQSRSDRDQFITIVKSNIKKGKEGNFVQVHQSSAQGVPYDFDSVLHYSQKAFSADGQKPTIVSKVDPNRKNFGNRRGLTSYDTKKINLLYNCNRRSRF